MRKINKTAAAVAVSLLLCLLFGAVLPVYSRPMQDVSIDLSLIDKNAAFSAPREDFDNKGWEVYTREGDVITPLETDGSGFYTGIELGQTLYLSRVLVEDMDNPTLQIGTAERTFVVFLDDRVIYSDHPDMDCRIGYLQLPMGEHRSDPVTVTLPAGYQGKTLTIAQSTPPYAEGSTIKAAPAGVILHCGYAYESGIIAETYTLAMAAAAMFAVGVLLLFAFVRRGDWSILFIALTAFLGMCILLNDASFRYRYFGSNNNFHWYLRWLAALALLIYLTMKGSGHKKLLQKLIAFCVGYTPVSFLLYLLFHDRVVGIHNFLFYTLLELVYPIVLAIIMVLGLVYWRKDSRFYRVYAILLPVGLAVYWVACCLADSAAADIGRSLLLPLSSYRVYRGCLLTAMATAIPAALWDAVQTELEYRTEQHLMEQRNEMTLASYENLRRQHEEVMVIRHDMLRHFRTLHDMGGDDRRTRYLAELIGQNQKIRPIVDSGNEMLDIILNSRLGAAVDAGIRVELPHVSAPPRLAVSDPDLCALIMNVVDNAIDAAAKSASPYLLLKIHRRNGQLGITCENSFDPRAQASKAKKETVPKHGLGLKIIRRIAEKYNGAVTEEIHGDRYTIKIALPI